MLHLVCVRPPVRSTTSIRVNIRGANIGRAQKQDGRFGMVRRFENYLAGSIMLLIGLLLIVFLLGVVGAGFLPALFLIGVGVIFLVLAVLKARVPVLYEMSVRTTLAYGVLLVIIGVLWVTLSVQLVIAGYVLAVFLVFFGLVFLAYTRIKPTSV